MTTRPAASASVSTRSSLAIAPADLLGVDDVEAALDQPLDNHPGEHSSAKKVGMRGSLG
jgi:hypothetical protein